VKLTHLPPGCGEDLDKVLLFNQYQQAFQNARRERFCLNCNTVGSMDENGRFTCAKCGMSHTNNLTAPRLYDKFLLLAGRGGGKTLIGAHAVREECLIPESIIWVMGPNHKWLHDSTFPTLIRLIPPTWVKKWDAEHMDLRLQNNTLLAFRSLEDPERARGPHGVTCGWFDEAAQCPERAFDVFEPTLIRASGIVICTTTVLGFDWTYDKIEKKALVYHEPGYWATRYWTIENPLFQSNPVMRQKIEQAEKTMDPAFFAQEYKAERRNATGLVYNYSKLEQQYLKDDDSIRKILPEWPRINPDRTLLIGLDSGADHPFGAVLGVVTEKGIVIVRNYLKRLQAISQQLDAVSTELGVPRFAGEKQKWCANKNEINLRLEFGLRGVGVTPVENKHEIGIQRVASWLHAGQLWFTYTAKETFDQMCSYRYATNVKPDSTKKVKEEVFKLKDELCDGVRYLVMGWPTLPDPEQSAMTDAEKARWEAMDDRTKLDIERVRAFNKRKTDDEMSVVEDGYPIGDFFGSNMSWEG
jgi:hypothetical protein